MEEETVEPPRGPETDESSSESEEEDEEEEMTIP
ncbi:unnamed protein product, partial [Allacma fusca]